MRTNIEPSGNDCASFYERQRLIIEQNPHTILMDVYRAVRGDSAYFREALRIDHL